MSNTQELLPPLLPCPFCLGPAGITSTVGGDEGDGYNWHVFCAEDNDCAMMPDTFAESERVAIHRWNSRTPSVSPPELSRDELSVIKNVLELCPARFTHSSACPTFQHHFNDHAEGGTTYHPSLCNCEFGEMLSALKLVKLKLSTSPPAVDLTVESALAELRTMFPGNYCLQFNDDSLDAVAKVRVHIRIVTKRAGPETQWEDFKGHSVADAMQKVREWKEQK